MNKQTELINTRKLVEKVLKNDEQARNSDAILYVRVCQEIDEKLVMRPFFYVLANYKKLGLPCFETVRRSRQLLQSRDENLRACEAVTDARKENEEVFLDFVRGVNNER